MVSSVVYYALSITIIQKSTIFFRTTKLRPVHLHVHPLRPASGPPAFARRCGNTPQHYSPSSIRRNAAHDSSRGSRKWKVDSPSFSAVRRFTARSSIKSVSAGSSE